jgi:hypothetical protein
MYWFTSSDRTRFLVQTPPECALSLERAFPHPGGPVTAERFMRQVKKECPLPPASGQARPKGRTGRGAGKRPG